MKKLFYLSLLFLSISSYNFSQTLLWSDDFETTSANWNLTIQPSPNASNANIWKISDEEGGVAPGGCGVASNGNKTLHVTCQGITCIGTGALYFSGDGGMYGMDATTDIRAALTTPISTVGKTNLEVTFDWIGVGDAGQDFAKLEYSVDGGTTWTSIWSQTPGAVCGGGQGQWAAQTVPLPVATENQADLRFAFHWVNNNDMNGSDPSFAVNDLKLFTNAVTGTPPVADFTTASFTICKGDCINFTDLSTNSPTSWAWSFTGAATTSSTSQNPTNICYNTAGTYNVSLTATNASGSDTKTIQITVNDCSAGPTSDFSTPSTTICMGDCIDFTDQSTGSGIYIWDWVFNGSDTPTSNGQNPSNICYNTAGTFNVTLTVTDANGTDTKTIQIIVNDCSTGTPPTAMFVPDTLIVCMGDCISFTDLSTGDPTSWAWDFDGASPATSTKQHPAKVCFNEARDYNISLTVSNNYGNDQIINAVHVNEGPEIIGYGDTIIEMNGTAVIWAEPQEPGYFYWDPASYLDCDTCLVANASPYITTVYYPSLIGVNGCVGRDTVVVQVKFKEIVEVPSAFSPGAGNNNLLHVLGIGITSIDFKIFNRYGQLIFQTTDINEGWNGSYNGKPLNQGVFVYTLDYTLIDGTTGMKKGNVTLIK
ncbi:MAG: PKD domain-containing protein [Brumimicrobium sp.]|nr:PKD domain-containing protein [Brumimicrobium sp.]